MPRTLITETFPYSDGSLGLAVGTATWQSDSVYARLNVLSNLLKSHASLDAVNLIKAAAWVGSTSAQWSETTIAVTGPAIGPGCFFDGAGAFYLAECGPDVVKILRRSGGVITELAVSATVTNGYFANGGDVALFQAQDINGASELLVYRNGVLQMSFSDNTVDRLMSGRPGVRMIAGSLNARISAFRAGDMSNSSGVGGGYRTRYGNRYRNR